MSTSPVSGNSIQQELHAYFQQRTSDQEQLGKALQSGDLATAQQEYNAIQTLAQSGPFANGTAYIVTQRQQDFAAVGQALQAGDLAGAQQAFAAFRSTFQKSPTQVQQQADQNPAVVVNIGGSSASGAAAGGSPVSAAQPPVSPANSGPEASGNEIIVNLGNLTAGEQITIGVSNASNGAEQVTIGVGNQQNQNTEQITLNLNQNSNQQVILNLFNSGSTATSSAPSSGFSASA